MNEQSAFERVLADLAGSRGMDLEELRERMEEAGHTRVARTLLTEPRAGFGVCVDEILCLEEAERERLAHSFAATFMTEKGYHTCQVSECERPAEESDFSICAEHRAEWKAMSEKDGWGLALKVLRPWVEAAHPIGSDELSSVMDRALEDAETHYAAATADLEQARAAL